LETIMKKILLATAALIALGAAPALAADLGARVYTKAPPAPIAAVYDWTGFYVGGHVGYGWADQDWALTAGAPLGSHSSDGFLGGLQAGYNVQFNQIVVGVEGDISWADLNGAGVCGAAGLCSTSTDWLATVTGRLGYAFDNALLYGKGGVAFAGNDYAETAGPGTASETKTGWTVGVGLEYAFAPNWSTKVEYNYMDFGTDGLIFSDGAPISVDQTANVVKFGINYKFGGPLVARY